MPLFRRTQKEISNRYQGNLDYYGQFHPWRRAWRLVSLLAVVATILAIWLFSRGGGEEFFNPGPISSSHGKIADNCGACHEQALTRAIQPSAISAIVKERLRNGVTIDAIDRKCAVCHEQHSFHEANVVQPRSCSACHREHQGPGPLQMVATGNCLSCHGNADRMQAAAVKGSQLPPAAFRRHPHPPQQTVLELPRPASGFTEVFRSFAGEHPEFQLIRTGARDPDTLRFNHERHFAADIPPVHGKKLDCAYCHWSEPNGRYYQRVSFEANCQACHSLQFDPRNPELKIPHGDPQLVRAFLRTLPAQYADYARLKKGKTSEGEINSFVAGQIRQLRQEFRTGEALERAVFFTTDPYKPQRQMAAAGQAHFAGCAFCHQVKEAANGEAAVTAPILTDRWMPRAKFDHAKHASIQCDDCHHASHSRETSDVLMPAKATCVTCHSPAGKAGTECILCHTFHAPPAAQTITAVGPGGAPSSLRRMLAASDQGRESRAVIKWKPPP